MALQSGFKLKSVNLLKIGPLTQPNNPRTKILLNPAYLKLNSSFIDV